MQWLQRVSKHANPRTKHADTGPTRSERGECIQNRTVNAHVVDKEFGVQLRGLVLEERLHDGAKVDVGVKEVLRKSQDLNSGAVQIR